MKTMKVFLLAVLVTMTGLFTACSSDDAVTDTTENERGVVKAEFTISFPQKVGTTRMSAATVQASGQAFRGIRNIELYPFVNMAALAVGGSATIPSMISLLAGTSLGKTGASSTTNPNEIASSGALFTTSNSHLYQNVDIPLHTQSFMFYGEAIPSGTDAAVNGALTKSLASSGTTLNDSYNPDELSYLRNWIDGAGEPFTNAFPTGVNEIVQEEIGEWLSGMGTPEDCAKKIQSRASIWLAEHK